MTNLREAAQMALDALEECLGWTHSDLTEAAAEALRAALAQPEQEPVWGDSQVTKPEIVAEQKAMNESLRKMVEQEPPQQPELVIQARKEGNLIVVDLPQVPRGSGGITKDEQPEPRREWMGLTHEELEFYTEELGQGELGRGVLRAVVDFLKEKNT